MLDFIKDFIGDTIKRYGLDKTYIITITKGIVNIIIKVNDIVIADIWYPQAPAD